jgi:hypothetical protein
VRGAFVSVDERVIPGEPVSERRREGGKIRRGIAIRMQLLPARER